MNRPALATSIILALPALTTLTGCGILHSFSQEEGSATLNEVDDLLNRIERVHVECELSRQSMRDAIAHLHTIVGEERDEDLMAAFTQFQVAITASEQRAEALRGAVSPMKASAGPFFERWANDLAAFKSVEMRQRSEARLAATRDRYQAIVVAVDPTMATYGVFNQGLRDHALFLSYDFNPASVAELEIEARELTRLAGELDQRFASCLDATRAYVESAALPVRPEEAPATETGTGTEPRAVKDAGEIPADG